MMVPATSKHGMRGEVIVVAPSQVSSYGEIPVAWTRISTWLSLGIGVGSEERIREEEPGVSEVSLVSGK